jgi:V8-like Glu-specific endopeptidase
VSFEGITKNILITADHIFGPDGGVKTHIGVKNIMDSLHDASFFTMDGKLTSVKLINPITPGSQPYQKGDIAKDAIGFEVTNSSTHPALKFAKVLPKNGEKCWIAGCEFTSEIKEQHMYECKKINDENGIMKIAPKDTVHLSGFSGAPVLNSRSEVIGIVIAGTMDTLIVNGMPNIVNLLKNWLMQQKRK